jgi:hypothetical protein
MLERLLAATNLQTRQKTAASGEWRVADENGSNVGVAISHDQFARPFAAMTKLSAATNLPRLPTCRFADLPTCRFVGVAISHD